MNPLFLLALGSIAVLLGLDWSIKKNRQAERLELDDDSFLLEFRGAQSTPSDLRILNLRRDLAEELGLPKSILRPEDRLNEIRDRYCLVVSGDLALSDLYEDLESKDPDGNASASRKPNPPETVGDYISLFLQISDDAID